MVLDLLYQIKSQNIEMSVLFWLFNDIFCFFITSDYTWLCINIFTFCIIMNQKKELQIVTKLKLPADITEQEMKDILQDIRKEYVPWETSDFVNELNKEQLIILFDLISTKDQSQREKKWDIIKQKIYESNESFKRILQKLKLTQIQFEEKKDHEENDTSLESLENQF